MSPRSAVRAFAAGLESRVAAVLGRRIPERATPARFLSTIVTASSVATSTTSSKAKASRSSARHFERRKQRGRRTLRRHDPPRLSRLAPDRKPQATRARPPRLRRPLQHPQATSRSRADTADTRGPPTSRRFEPARPTPPTRPTRRTDPRIRSSSMTDGFAYPTASMGSRVPFRATLTTFTRVAKTLKRCGAGSDATSRSSSASCGLRRSKSKRARIETHIPRHGRRHGVRRRDRRDRRRVRIA